MRTLRSWHVVGVAATISTLSLTGCLAPGAMPGNTNVAVSPSASSSPATGASMAPSAAPASAAPSASASGVPSAAPSVIPSPVNLGTSVVRGKVYDQTGALVSSIVKVTVKSLNSSTPFESTVDTISGSYVVAGVPAGVQLQITAAISGWTTRTRVETLLSGRTADKNIVNFGGTDTTDDANAPAFFISGYPEIISVDPADKSLGAPADKLVYKLTLSEPLDATNQTRFANALRVFPANNFSATNSSATTNLELADDGSDDLYVSSGAVKSYTSGKTSGYSVSRNAVFMADDATKASVTWDAEGKVATLTFNAPLITNRTDAAKYAVALFPQSTDGIQDLGGANLGFPVPGSLGNAPTANDMLIGVFKKTELSYSPANGDTATTRWKATHNGYAVFKTKIDDVDPTLTNVGVTTASKYTRVLMTFSEPMAAYAGDSATSIKVGDSSLAAALASPDSVSSTTLQTVLDNITFAVADTAARLDTVKVDGEPSTGGTELTPIDSNFNSASNKEKEFKFRVTNWSLGNLVTTAPIKFSIDPKDAKVVRMDIYGTDIGLATGVNAFRFGTDAKVTGIKARVSGFADPASNAIKSADADKNVKTVSF